jgi:hypothetical protein
MDSAPASAVSFATPDRPSAADFRSTASLSPFDDAPLRGSLDGSRARAAMHTAATAAVATGVADAATMSNTSPTATLQSQPPLVASQAAPPPPRSSEPVSQVFARLASSLVIDPVLRAVRAARQVADLGDQIRQVYDEATSAEQRRDDQARSMRLACAFGAWCAFVALKEVGVWRRLRLTALPAQAS